MIPAVTPCSCICVCRVSLPDLLPPMFPNEIVVICKTRVIIIYYYYHINTHITICVHSFFFSYLLLPSLTRSLPGRALISPEGTYTRIHIYAFSCDENREFISRAGNNNHRWRWKGSINLYEYPSRRKKANTPETGK